MSGGMDCGGWACRTGEGVGALVERGRPEDVEADCVTGVRRTG